jgi:hypothetical protein
MAELSINKALAPARFVLIAHFLGASRSCHAAQHASAIHINARPKIIGLTSPGNVAFSESLSCYDQVIAYDQIESLGVTQPCTYVDFAGNTALRRRIHGHFAQLKYSCAVGGTHVRELGGAKDLPGPKATLFFAPA